MSGEQMSGEQMSFGERMSLWEWERLSRGINRPGMNVRERMSGDRLSLGNKREGPVSTATLPAPCVLNKTTCAAASMTGLKI